MKLFLSKSAKVCILLFLVFLGPQSARPQATTGSFVGRVTDPTNAVVSGAQVQAVNEATGIEYQSVSNENGDYVVSQVPPGFYMVSAAKAGFETATAKHLELLIDQKLLVNFPLILGATSTVTTVIADTPTLQTQSAETGEVIETKDILDLPLLGRNFLDLARLTAGVVSASGGNTLNLSVNGQREFANSVLVDGVEATANRNNDTNVRPSVDAVQEFKVSTSDYSAQFGRASGGVISIQTKSGSNALHGSVYDFYRPNATAAEDFAFPGSTGQPLNLSQNNFGGTLGGPIKKDKTFFFLSYEQERERNLISFLDSVPPTNQIVFQPGGGVDLSGLKDPLTGNQVPIFNPNFYAQNFFSQQFPGNVIPACPAGSVPDGSCVSPAGRAILQKFFPTPNLPGTFNGWFNNFQTHSPFAFNERTGDARIDHEFSAKDRLSVVYHYLDFNSLTADPFSGATSVPGAGDADQGDKEDSRNQELSVTETHLFSNRFINEFRFGYTRFHLNELSLLNGQDLSTQFGLGNIAVPGFSSTLGFPDLFLGTGYQAGGSTFKPLFFTDSNFQIQDNIILTDVGRHEFRMGVDFRRLNSHPVFSLFPTGFQFYAGAFSSLTSDPNFAFFDPNAFFGNGGSDIADLLLGLPESVNIGLQLTTPHTQSWEIHFYGEDTFKVTPKFTFIYGVRYEYQNPYVEASNDSSNYDPATNSILLAGRGGNSSALVNGRKNDFSPRVGLAYQLTRKMVVRAGYGLFYSPENDAREDVLTKNFPFAVQSVYSNSVFDGLPFTYQLDQGIPRSTVIPIPSGASSIAASAVPNGGVQTIFYVDPNLRTGYSQLFNLSIQRELSSSISVEAGYVGSLSHDLPYAIGNINLDSRLTKSLGQIQAQESLGIAKYNSLQLKAKMRSSRNLSFLAAYTYGHNIDNGPAPFDLGKNHDQPQNPFDLNAEIGSSDYDVRHTFVFSSTYRLPFGKGQQFGNNWSGVEDAILGGWQLNGIFTAHTGLPFNVIQDGNNRNAPGLRPNVTANPNLPNGQRTLLEYFNTAAFCVPTKSNMCPALGPNGEGDAGRNILNGPGLVNGDVSVFKNFAIKESKTLQTRFEFFNVTNTPHFGNPAADLSQHGSFGRITSLTVGPRVIQFAAKFLF